MFRITPYERRNYDIFDAFKNFEKEFFNIGSNSNVFKVDVRDEENRYIVEADLPGFKKEDIQLNIDGDYLILKAERSHENTEEKSNYVFRERSFGSYERSFNIKSVKVDEIEADYKNGVLSVYLPKKTPEQQKNKSIEIKYSDLN